MSKALIVALYSIAVLGSFAGSAYVGVELYGVGYRWGEQAVLHNRIHNGHVECVQNAANVPGNTQADIRSICGR